MKLKNLVIGIGSLIQCFMLAAQANEFTVINPSHKTSPAAIFAQAFRDAAGAEYYQAADCEDAARKYNNTENAVFIYNSSMEFAALNKGMSCSLKDVKNKIVIFTGVHYFNVIRHPDSTVDPADKGVPFTYGMASMLATKAHETDWRNHGYEMTMVPYSGSQTVLRAVLSKDIEVGIIGQGIAFDAGDTIEILYSTEPGTVNYLGDAVHGLAIPDFHISYVVYTNATDPKLIAKLHNIKFSQSFNTFLDKSMTQGSFDAVEIKSTEDFVARMYNAWRDK